VLYAMGATALVLLALVAGLLLFLVSPPSDLVRRAALPIARQALSHPRLNIGGMSLLPGSRLELRDVLLGPPAGYHRPLLRLGRLVLRYDLSAVHRGEITILQAQLDRPVVHLETVGKKTNWEAFLAALTTGEPEPKPEPSGSMPDIKVQLADLSITGLAAAVEDGARKIVLDQVSLGLNGFFSPKSSDLKLRVTVAPRPGATASVRLDQQKPSPVEAALDAKLELKVRVRDLLRGPRADLTLEADVQSHKLRAPKELAPARLALRLAADADLGRGRIKISRLGLALAEEPLVDFTGTVTDLAGKQRLDLLLRRLRLPLDRLMPYLRPFVPGVELGGLVELRDLRLRSDRPELEALIRPGASAAPALPRLSARLLLSRVRARLKKQSPAGMALDARNLDLDLALAAGGAAASTPAALLQAVPDPATPPSSAALATSTAPLAVLGRLRLGAFKGAGVRARGIDLRLAGGLGLDGGLQPGPAGARMTLRIPTLTYTSRATGRLSLGVSASMAGSAQMRQRRARLRELELKLPGLLQARLSGNLEQWGARSLAAQLEIKPLDLARVIAWLPGELKAPLGRMKLTGKLGLTANVTGRLPGAGPMRPLDLPLAGKVKLGLTRIGLDDPGRKITAGPLDGDLGLTARAGALALDGKLTLGALSMSDQKLVISGVTLDPDLRLGRRALDSRLVLGLKRAHKEDLGLTVKALRLDHRLAAALPAARLLSGRSARLGKTRASVDWTVGSMAMALPANTLSLKQKATQLQATYDPARGGTSTIKLTSTLARASHQEQGMLAEGLKLSFADSVTGHGGISLPRPRPHLTGLASTHQGSMTLDTLRLGRLGLSATGLGVKMSGDLSGFSLTGPAVKLKQVSHKVAAEMARVTLRGVVDRPLLKNTLALDLSLRDLKDLDLRQLSLRMPTRGIYLDLSGEGKDLIPLDTGRLPPFQLTLAAGIDAPATTEEARSTFLYPGVRGAGKLGAELSLRSRGGEKLRLAGRLLGRSFHLWQRGGSGARASHIQLRDLDADIPFQQTLLLRRGRLRLPAPSVAITDLSNRTALYHELRPYTRRAAGLTLGGMSLERPTARGPQRLQLDRAHLDLTLADNALKMRRLYLKLFGGDIAGAMQVQVLSLAPLDLVLHLRTQVTGVNLAYLNPDARGRDSETEVSALLDFGYRPAREELEGRVEITRLSLKMLDSLLAYLDPDGTNGSVQENRKLLGSWYLKWIDPRVQLVSLWIKHGNLNMDIDMDAWFVVGTVLKRVLRNMRIRRLNILPVLRREVTPILRKVERALGAKKVAKK